MKKIIIVFLLLCVVSVFSEEINLYSDNNDTIKTFSKLNMTDQYYSYINTFRYNIRLGDRQLYWARFIVKQHGRSVLSLIEEDIKKSTFNHLYRAPYDDILGLISYILEEMKRLEILTEEDKTKYRDLYEKKLEDYVLEFRIIDGSVSYGMICIESFTELPVYLSYDTVKLIKYYNEKLGINDVIAGDLYSHWEY